MSVEDEFEVIRVAVVAFPDGYALWLEVRDLDDAPKLISDHVEAWKRRVGPETLDALRAAGCDGSGVVELRMRRSDYNRIACGNAVTLLAAPSPAPLAGLEELLGELEREIKRGQLTAGGETTDAHLKRSFALRLRAAVGIPEEAAQ
jgi:hypothetical protein